MPHPRRLLVIAARVGKRYEGVTEAPEVLLSAAIPGPKIETSGIRAKGVGGLWHLESQLMEFLKSNQQSNSRLSCQLFQILPPFPLNL